MSHSRPQRPASRPPTVRAALTALFVCIAAATARAATPIDADTLLGRIAQPPPATIRYTEVRYSSLLTQPLVVSGRLAYLGPGRFDREVESPYREKTTIRGGEVLVEREGQAPTRFSLKRAPALDGMLETFGALLSGDASLLDRSFEVTLTGDDGAWRIGLVPRSKSVAKWLSDITIDGAGNAPRCVTLAEPDGDRGVMLLGPLADEPLPAALDPSSLESRCVARPRN